MDFFSNKQYYFYHNTLNKQNKSKFAVLLNIPVIKSLYGNSLQKSGAENGQNRSPA